MAYPSQHPPQPAIVSPEDEPVHSPVRDDAALGPTEDLDREPDGMPHHVIGLTALFTVMLAMLVGFMIVAGGTVSRIGAVLIAVMAIPVLVSTLRRRADEGRDRIHPSR